MTARTAGSDHRRGRIRRICAVAAVGWWLHPDPSILTTEHLFAFLIGCVIASWQPSARPRTDVVLRLVRDRRNAAQHA